MKTLRVGSLCTGYGGIEMGLRSTGLDIDVRWLAETEPALTSLHGETPNLGDIQRVRWSRVAPVDTLTAGFPCQPVSLAGSALGSTDPRWLWAAVRRGIRAMSPDRVFIENVDSLVTYAGGQLWSVMLGDLTRLGYGVRWLTIGACHIGAAHHRHRVFALATRGSGIVRRVPALPCGRNGLLPTPIARDGDHRGEASSQFWIERRAHRGKGIPLGATLVTLPGHWGPYGDAILMHEARYGTAPRATETNRNGTPRLAAEFAEWLMCLPSGHVTSKLDRVAALRAIGNGACPPQVARAWELLT